MKKVLPVLVLTLALLVGCDSIPSEVEAPIVFIGVDSADWTWIDPLVAEGRMPNVQRLAEGGTRGPLRSLEPLDKSPTIWTTIATGKRPVKHGIVGFIERDSKITTSEHRTATTYWEILGHLGMRQAVLGWWVTHPAPRTNGVLVSDFLPYFDVRAQQNENAVYPPQLWPELEPLVVHPEDVTDAQLERFVDAELWREHHDEATALLADLRAYVAGDLTYLNMAKALYAKESWPVFTVYFRGLDLMSHKYWRWFEPRYSGVDPEDWRVHMLDSVVPEYHVFVDELVGQVLEMIEVESRVLLVSDHGFVGHRRGRRGLTQGVDMHRVDGVLVVHGPGIRAGHTIEGAGVMDVMPTVLAMKGVPLAADLDGEVLVDVFDSAMRKFVEGTFREHEVATYEGVVPREGIEVDIDPETNAAVLEQLRSLGYID